MTIGIFQLDGVELVIGSVNPTRMAKPTSLLTKETVYKLSPTPSNRKITIVICSTGTTQRRGHKPVIVEELSLANGRTIVSPNITAGSSPHINNRCSLKDSCHRLINIHGRPSEGKVDSEILGPLVGQPMEPDLEPCWTSIELLPTTMTTTSKMSFSSYQHFSTGFPLMKEQMRIFQCCRFRRILRRQQG